MNVTVTRCVVDTVQQARTLNDESLAKLTVLTDATNQKISLTKHLAKECNLEVIQFPIFIFILYGKSVFTAVLIRHMFCNLSCLVLTACFVADTTSHCAACNTNLLIIIMAVQQTLH